ncbi:MAG: patatin-like phospholipase family protein [Candidatus Binatia bacterium]
MNTGFRIGLALGGGGAAALSYGGVLEEFVAAGIPIHCVAGTSAGAVVGAAYAANRLDDFHQVMTSLTRGRLFTLFDPTWGRGGLIDGRRAMDMLSPVIGTDIEDLRIPFAAVATDLDTGEEVVLDRGPVIDAVRASIAIPGVFRPRTIDSRVLVDGGLVNPIPVSVARQMGADFVIAVSILRLRGVIEGDPASALSIQELAPAGDGAARSPEAEVEMVATEQPCEPSLLDVLAKGSAVIQAHIAAARLRDHPPDVFLSPRSEHIGIFELVRCAEAIEIGRVAARKALPGLLAAIEAAQRPPVSKLRSLFVRGAGKASRNLKPLRPHDTNGHEELAGQVATTRTSTQET